MKQKSCNFYRIRWTALSWIATLPLLISCKKEASKQLTPSFYYWQTTYQPTPSDLQRLRQLQVQKLYIRYFDVDWNPATQSPTPKAVIQFAQQPVGFAMVPVVFLTNQTLIHCPASAIPALAENLFRKINQLSQQNGIAFQEIQLDCDWSARSRERYFQLIREVKTRFSGTVSATIRLHQIKYPEQTGLPPADRGMLMFYNMGDWKRPDTRNSILDLTVAGRYLDDLKHYSLPLDVVLPLFRWTVVYRNNRFLTLLNNVDQQKLTACSFLKPEEKNRFVAVQDTAAFGFSIRRGDRFRAEECQPADLTRAKELLLSKISNQKLTFALYHLDSTVISPYSDAFLQSLFRSSP